MEFSVFFLISSVVALLGVIVGWKLVFKSKKTAVESYPPLTKSPKGKAPYVMFENGEIMGDSALIIERIEGLLKENGLDHDVPKKTLAFAQAFRVMMEEHFYFAVVWYRWIWDESWPTMKTHILAPIAPFPASLFIPNYLRSIVRKQLRSQGMGRHSAEEISHLADSDLKALSVWLESLASPYFGGIKPCVADATVFGFLAFILEGSFRTPVRDIAEKYPVLQEYVNLVKAEYYPDWEELITPS